MEKTLAVLDRKALLPPLGLNTVAALLPQDWSFRLVDQNVWQLPMLIETGLML